MSVRSTTRLPLRPQRNSRLPLKRCALGSPKQLAGYRFGNGYPVYVFHVGLRVACAARLRGLAPFSPPLFLEVTLRRL